MQNAAKIVQHKPRDVSYIYASLLLNVTYYKSSIDETGLALLRMR